MSSFKCKDIGMKCGFELKDESKDEMMKMISMHAGETHKLKEISPEMKEKIEKAIKK